MINSVDIFDAIEAYMNKHPSEPIDEALLSYGVDRVYRMILRCQREGLYFGWQSNPELIDGDVVVLKKKPTIVTIR